MTQEFKVPIRNLFYILSYVTDFPELKNSLNDVDGELISYDFIVRKFVNEVETLGRKGLINRYVTQELHANIISGKVILNESIPYLMSKKPMLVCESDEYKTNNLFNQILKETLVSISKNILVSNDLRAKCIGLLGKLSAVETISLTSALFNRMYFTGNSLYYKRAIHIARLLFELKLLTHKKGSLRLFSAEIEERLLSNLFERFLFNFYQAEQEDYQVSSEQMNWKLKGDLRFLPQMRTDISLTHRKEQRKIIIDAKFYKNVYQVYYGKESFHSQNMYQLFTYLMHQDTSFEEVRGILIYPYNGTTVDESYSWSERISLQVVTISLDSPWENINKNLINFLS